LLAIVFYPCPTTKGGHTHSKALVENKLHDDLAVSDERRKWGIVGTIGVTDRHDSDDHVSNSTEPEPCNHGPEDHTVDIDQPYGKSGKEAKERDVDEHGYCPDHQLNVRLLKAFRKECTSLGTVLQILP
jgi:hypothetical protein